MTSLAAQNNNPASFFDGRDGMRKAFLAQNGWGDAEASLMAEDWAARRFWRFEQNGQTRIVMESVPDDHPESTPGHKISEMVRIGEWLQGIGAHVPEIEAADIENGFLLMEDVGSQVLPLTADAYTCAADVLKVIRARYTGNALSLPEFKGSRIDVAKRRIIDWFLPLSRGRQNDGSELAAYNTIWQDIENTLPDCPQTFLHMDYHAGNLMWLDGEEGMSRCALLDFQGAYYGPLPYDLTNLLEDIRRDVPDDIKRAVITSYYDDMAAAEKETFDIWHKVLAMQFHCRIAGQLVKLYQAKGRAEYLDDYLPRTLKYIETALSDEIFAPLAALFKDMGLGLQKPDDITPDSIKALVAPDAY